MNDFASWDAGLHTADPNSLQHYGVLGMKWGERRYQNPDGSLTAAGKRHYDQTGEYGYHYKSHATKKYAKKAAKNMRKAEAYDVGSRVAKSHGNDVNAQKHAAKRDKYAAKAQKFLNRAKRSAEIDRGEQEYAKGLSTGKALALSILAGDRVKGYAQYRAMSGQSGKNMTGGKVTSAVLGYYMGSAGSRQRKAAYIRQDEGKNGLGQKVFKLNNKIQSKASDVIDRTAQANGGFPDREKQRKKRG